MFGDTDATKAGTLGDTLGRHIVGVRSEQQSVDTEFGLYPLD